MTEYKAHEYIESLEGNIHFYDTENINKRLWIKDLLSLVKEQEERICTLESMMFRILNEKS